MTLATNSIQRLINNVLDPRGRQIQASETLPMAPRLDTLNGKTVYLIDGRFGGGNELLEEMQGWFSENMPEVKTVLKRKEGNMFMDDHDLWSEIKEKGHAVVMGVGG